MYYYLEKAQNAAANCTVRAPEHPEDADALAVDECKAKLGSVDNLAADAYCGKRRRTNAVLTMAGIIQETAWESPTLY
jgi:hypothetical protein